MYAKMFPLAIQEDHPRLQGGRGDAEREFFCTLRDQLNDQWRVMWGKDLLSPAPIDGSREGEAGFIAVYPDYGLYVIEVKGGGLDYDPEKHIWTSWGRNGQEHELYSSPSAQVQRTCRILRAIFQNDRKCPSFLRSKYYQLSWAVVFNQCRIAGDLPVDLPRDLVIDETDLDIIEYKFANEIHRYFLNEATVTIQERESRRGPRNRFHGLNHREVESEVKDECFRIREDGDGWKYLQARFLASELKVRPPHLSTQIAKEVERIAYFTDEQYRVIELLETKDNHRAKVRGCSGSGKTLCAIEQARRFAKQKQRVLFLCFNSALRDWLRREMKITISLSSTFMASVTLTCQTCRQQKY